MYYVFIYFLCISFMYYKRSNLFFEIFTKSFDFVELFYLINKYIKIFYKKLQKTYRKINLL